MMDAHHHFWWIGRHRYHAAARLRRAGAGACVGAGLGPTPFIGTWPEAVGNRFARDFTSDDLGPELERCGITGTVLIQVLHQLEGETLECLELSKEVGFVRGVVGWLPLVTQTLDPDATARALQRLNSTEGKLVGVRHLINNEPDPRWLLQDRVIESLKLAAATILAGRLFRSRAGSHGRP